MARQKADRLRRGELVEFNTELKETLEKFASNQEVVTDVVGAVAKQYKDDAREANRERFTQRSCRYNKSIWYKHMGRRSRRTTLYGGNLSAIYEYYGADISAKALSFASRHGVMSNINNKYGYPPFIASGTVHVEPRPWFYNSIRRTRDSGRAMKAADRQLLWELKQGRLWQ
jgi:hypothetical protein